MFETGVDVSSLVGSASITFLGLALFSRLSLFPLDQQARLWAHLLLDQTVPLCLNLDFLVFGKGRWMRTE